MKSKCNMLTYYNFKWETLMIERNLRKERKLRRFNMKKRVEIDSWRMKLEEKERKRDVKRNSIQFWSKELKRRNKKLRLCNFREKFKALSISRDLRLKMRLINKLLLKELMKRKLGILRHNRITVDYLMSKRRPVKRNY